MQDDYIGVGVGGKATSIFDSVSTCTEQLDSIKEVDIDERDDDHDDDHCGRIRLGICAMDKKARSKPMAEILSRLSEENFRVIFFGDNVILNSPIEEWPKCDALIAFFSKGYPLQKVKEYAALRKPFILNDLSMQDIIKDRRRIYDLLADMGIDVPRHVFVNRDGYKSTRRGEASTTNADAESMTTPEDRPNIIECDDHIEVDKVVIHKPFVEKPVNAEGTIFACHAILCECI
jgi:inositol-hexakisphosphate/diphosphoinositol-pentakisphosphate 1-kinase